MGTNNKTRSVIRPYQKSKIYSEIGYHVIENRKSQAPSAETLDFDPINRVFLLVLAIAWKYANNSSAQHTIFVADSS